jgi:hypothetical protein
MKKKNMNLMIVLGDCVRSDFWHKVVSCGTPCFLFVYSTQFFMIYFFSRLSILLTNLVVSLFPFSQIPFSCLEFDFFSLFIINK